MTITAPETPAPAPQYAAPGTRFVAIRANLLPAEIMRARRAIVVRKRVAIALAVLAVLLVAGYGWSWWQTRSATSELATTQQQTVQLEHQQASFADLVEAQTATQSVRSQLQQLMVGDLPWNKLLTALRAKAPAGLSLDQIAGTVTDTAAGATTDSVVSGGLPVPATQGLPAGTLTLTGTARDKRSVADYADRLAKVKGIADPLVTSVASSGRKSVSFDMTADITTDALGGRWSTSTTTSTTPGTATTVPSGGN